MTNIDKKQPEEDVHSHEEILEFIKENLPSRYADEARGRLLDRGVDVSTTMIRNIKGGDPVNWQVLEVLAEIASENSNSRRNISRIINNQ